MSEWTSDFFDQSNPLYLTVDAGIGTLVLNRPHKKNAINMETWDHMPAYIAALENNPEVRVVVVMSSTEGSFCAGADISEFADIALDADLRERQRVGIREGQRRLARLKKPTIAMIDGPCIGAGCGLSIHCDFRIASLRSKFGITPAKLGLIYPLNDTKHLVDLVGPSHAKKILFTAGIFSAEEALRMGLVDEVVQVEDLELAVKAFAASMVPVSQYSLRGIKKSIQRILDGQADDDDTTSKWFTDAHTSSDYKEGVDAFMAKRKPKFTWND
ncbi:enoyl-CoA hydratase/isomerase family protein [Temperatibacter marinus]|uniref:Enoyl-CoA hydratase/isomerase family protein n=1 Tax=Temperatibacter marinus TaxID=1456591 RepID=A0AA52EHX9_9PROT|nr:enoyl-CoA hydratase/isomerase family protein [Temperatibacter marinus]WND02862.1 enoyl-CoA hydratase/isomerase family protein [Temperatibacter marinus]